MNTVIRNKKAKSMQITGLKDAVDFYDEAGKNYTLPFRKVIWFDIDRMEVFTCCYYSEEDEDNHFDSMTHNGLHVRLILGNFSSDEIKNGNKREKYAFIRCQIKNLLKGEKEK